MVKGGGNSNQGYKKGQIPKQITETETCRRGKQRTISRDDDAEKDEQRGGRVSDDEVCDPAATVDKVTDAYLPRV